MHDRNIELLHETLNILTQGRYDLNGRRVSLRLTAERMEAAQVFLPDDIREICGINTEKTGFNPALSVDCVNADSFVAAAELAHKRRAEDRGKKPVLVLNFANPVNIGGGVYKGAKAQEEDLCRRSSLLRSLESREASKYYRYNRSLRTYMGSDAMIFSPEVEVFRGPDGALMEETEMVSVLTCAAPMITRGLEGMSEDEYREMFFRRILGLLICAAHCQYEDLILGAWGCGAFGNNAAVVSDLFCRALRELNWNGLTAKDLFGSIVFAVRSRDGKSYNFREFSRNFGENRFLYS